MELITPDQRDELFDTFEHDAFHLELRDEYGVPGEDGPFARWIRGEPDDFVWLEPWLARIRAATRGGRSVRRVRVVSEPTTAYIRWEHATTPLTLEAGEDIRWLPRHSLPVNATMPLGGRDWWLFDGRLLAVGVFDHDGRVLGSELLTDPAIIAQCAAIRDQLWPLAVPHAEYKPT